MIDFLDMRGGLISLGVRFRTAGLQTPRSEMDMNFVMIGPPLFSLLAGISILIWPRLLNYIVAFWLILFGLVGLLPMMML